MIGESKAFLARKLSDWSLPPDGKWRALVFNNYQPQCTNINLLWFRNNEKFPRVVTKLSRQESVLRREFQHLSRAHPLASMWMPKPLAFEEQGAFYALWMTGVPGVSFVSITHSAAALRSVVSAIADIHEALRSSSSLSKGDRFQRLVLEPLKTVAEFRDDATVRAGCQVVAEEMTAKWLALVPIIPQHGDLFMGNILQHRGQWFVVDWEWFGTIDLPFYDLTIFTLSVLGAPEKTPDQWDRDVVQEVPALVRSYAERLHLETVEMSNILFLALANWFHLHHSDGRPNIAASLYTLIQHYFEDPDSWLKVFKAA